MTMEKINSDQNSSNLEKQSIVFIHGFPMSASIWNSQISALKEHYNCYAIDLPGYGSNIRQMDFTHSIDTYADYVYQFVKDNELGPVHIVGMSMGGSITLNISRRHKHVVKSMTLIHTSGIVDTDEEKKKRDETISFIQNGGLLQFIDNFADRLLSSKAGKEVRQKYISLMREASKEVVIAGYKAIRDRDDEMSNLPSLSIPVLVIAGNDDIGSSPKEMNDIADALINSKFEIIRDCGHVSPLEQPDVLSTLLMKWFKVSIN
jgi:3-oxoadipate enol-lactonase